MTDQHPEREPATDPNERGGVTPPLPTPAAAHGATGGPEAEARDAELAERELATDSVAEVRGLEAQRMSDELDRQAEAAVDALNRGAPD